MVNFNQQVIWLISFCMLISWSAPAQHERHIIHVPVFVHFVHHHHKVVQKKPRKNVLRYFHYPFPVKYQYRHVPHAAPPVFSAPPAKFRAVPLRQFRVPVSVKSSRVSVPKGFVHNHVHVYHTR